LRAKALPLSAIDLHLQSADIDFIAAKTRSAVASNGARTRIDQMVASDLRAEDALKIVARGTDKENRAAAA